MCPKCARKLNYGKIEEKQERRDKKKRKRDKSREKEVAVGEVSDPPRSRRRSSGTAGVVDDNEINGAAKSSSGADDLSRSEIWGGEAPKAKSEEEEMERYLQSMFP